MQEEIAGQQQEASPPEAEPDINENVVAYPEKVEVEAPTVQQQQEQQQQQQPEQEPEPEPEPVAAAEAPAKEEPAPPPPQPKSWASLFHSKAAAAAAASPSSDGAPTPEPDQKPTAKVMPFNQAADAERLEGGEEEEEDGGDHSLSPDELALVEFVRGHVLNHKSQAFRPRGLKNRSNWCFVNAVLQALTACPPFYNFFTTLPLFGLDGGFGPALGATAAEVARAASPSAKARRRWPILRALWEFFRGVEALGHFPRLNRSKNKKVEDLPLGKTVEATSVLSALLDLSSENFKVEEGRQEDAEEFLTFLLNGLSDDTAAVIKLVEKKEQEGAAEGAEGEEEEGDEDDWKEVGPKRRSCITRRTATSSTPVAGIFQGQIRSCVQHSAGQPTATLQPFFTLQLDIQSDSVHTVAEALENNFSTETLHGYAIHLSRIDFSFDFNIGTVSLFQLR